MKNGKNCTKKLIVLNFQWIFSNFLSQTHTHKSLNIKSKIASYLHTFFSNVFIINLLNIFSIYMFLFLFILEYWSYHYSFYFRRPPFTYLILYTTIPCHQQLTGTAIIRDTPRVVYASRKISMWKKNYAIAQGLITLDGAVAVLTSRLRWMLAPLCYDVIDRELHRAIAVVVIVVVVIVVHTTA